MDIFQQCAVLRRKQGMKPFRYAVLLTKTDLCEPWSLTFKGVDCLKQLQILDSRWLGHADVSKEPEQSDSYLAGVKVSSFFLRQKDGCATPRIPRGSGKAPGCLSSDAQSARH